jgi:hypothetical protein
MLNMLCQIKLTIQNDTKKWLEWKIMIAKYIKWKIMHNITNVIILTSKTFKKIIYLSTEVKIMVFFTKSQFWEIFFCLML